MPYPLQERVFFSTHRAVTELSCSLSLQTWLLVLAGTAQTAFLLHQRVHVGSPAMILEETAKLRERSWSFLPAFYGLCSPHEVT